ncbi:hypothetical protein [Spiroplasma eriocheiris]|uniref:Uncharacterized protein n=1 Tax=Spiroplasma eriocheiris TaxID=315358 RepID=A0A0H3XJT0_9MOLU|nr:hypothetical protein [Spiroplasma eriocheiris]AHF57680.1 hypothetical protein SPE_0552 [Spiroplasma eriocheiris CCTCC M 207170]AKM54131.1 hypothetical protein SERIO_v1c05590 [Spiroplasma eriocheiris]
MFEWLKLLWKKDTSIRDITSEMVEINRANFYEEYVKSKLAPEDWETFLKLCNDAKDICTTNLILHGLVPRSTHNFRINEKLTWRLTLHLSDCLFNRWTGSYHGMLLKFKEQCPEMLNFVPGWNSDIMRPTLIRDNYMEVMAYDRNKLNSNVLNHIRSASFDISNDELSRQFDDQHFGEEDFRWFYNFNLDIPSEEPPPLDNPPCVELPKEEVEKVELATAALKELCEEVKKKNQEKQQNIAQQIKEEEAKDQ